MKTHLFPAILALLAAGPAAAQTPRTAVLPGTQAPADVQSAAFFWAPSARFQFVLPAAALKPLLGCRLTALEFRNRANPISRITKGDAAVTVRAARAALPPPRASRTFDANFSGKPVLLADGTIHFEDATPGAGPTPWGDKRNLRIALNGSLLYRGGDLTLELIVRALPGKPLPFWLARALSWKAPARESYYGLPTPGTADDFRSTVFGSLAPGERTALTLDGVPAGAPAFLLLGLSDRRFLGIPLPLPVAFSGGKTVFLRTSPDLAFPVVAAPFPLPPGLSKKSNIHPYLARQGEASVTLDFPWDPSIAGGVLYAQWFSLGVMAPGWKVENRLASTRGIRLPVLSAWANWNAAFLSAEGTDPKTPPARAAGWTLRFLPEFRLQGRP